MSQLRRPSKPLLLGLAAAVVVLAVGVILLVTAKPVKSSSVTFAQVDHVAANNQMELCSDYAKLCFTRPAGWMRSHILHVAGSSSDTVEINPPTGTILEFAKLSSATTESCDTSKANACYVATRNITQLPNGLALLSATMTYAPPTCMDRCDQSSYEPFLRLMTSAEIAKLGLHAGATTGYTDFNPSVSLAGGLPVVLQVTPGKLSSREAADTWLTSSEAKTAAQILSSVRAE